ncbi:hypothetical protein ALQ97_03196 [Pseudomonas savastanoi pv. glycinea]|nr:hypothetical protein ALQ97_03196 [Pseudomonas savastanoi pv. glycinea]
MNNYSNLNKMVTLSNPSWDIAKKTGLASLEVDYDTSPYLMYEGQRIINMCSCSYLGLDTNADILLGAIEGIRRAGALHLTTARTRLSITLLGDLERALSEHYQGDAISYISCSAATSGFLPLFASGALTAEKKPVIVFDKFAHFSMNHVKPICADETEISTCPHNDMDYLETICKRRDSVAYVADGTYSVEGCTPISDLLYLQDKYGLYLYLDDSHGLSITGQRGEGYVLSTLGDLNDRTVVVGSLAKAFGTCGGMLISGNTTFKEKLVRYGNPWSQYLNSAGIGATLASLALHNTPLLTTLQTSWRKNLAILDSFFACLNRHTDSPIRVILLESDLHAINAATELLRQGYYTSSVFFPIVPKGTAGLRVMPRADISETEMAAFCQALKKVCESSINNEALA